MKFVSVPKGPRLLVPEVIQTSAMDCGPAALKCLLEGFGIPVSYPRLQEAVQTSIDGTSIDTIEQMAVTLGLDAEQIMLPADHLLLNAAGALPALIVVRRDNMTHFLVAWRRHGPFLQVMDPAKGRRWLREGALLEELYLHQHRVPASGWREWAGSPEFLGGLTERLTNLGLPAPACERLVASALGDPGWRGLAALDASTRMVAGFVRAGGLRRGREAEQVIGTLANRSAAGKDSHVDVPATYWSVLPVGHQSDESSDEELVLRGAVLLRVRKRRDAAAARDLDATPLSPAADDPAAPTVPRSLARALNEPAPRPLLEVWQMVRRDGLVTPAALIVAFTLAAAGVLFEMLLFRGFLEIEHVLTVRAHRLIAMFLLVAFVAALLALDVAISGGVLRIGRRLEARLRAALLEKLPRLGDRYFRSRLVSDMAYRAHAIDALRGLPELGARFVGNSTQLLFTAIALAWLDPPSAWIAVLAAGLALAIPLATAQMLTERELRQRSHVAALSRHYLDSLLGLTAARTHGAERALRRRHESLLVEWGRSGLHLLRGSVVIEGFQMLVGASLAAWLVLNFVSRGARPGGALLLVYWALSLPTLGRETAALIRRYPAYRNILLRVLEPLSAPDEGAADSTPAPAPSNAGVAVRLAGVEVVTNGHALVEGVDLSFEPGEHVAIVGRSGAGKSTFLGLLLGWRQPTSGAVLVDGAPLEGARLAQVRHRTAWVDPAVHLWNRSLFDNLRYGGDEALVSSIGPVIDTADLVEILEKLPAGLQSPLGEGGGLTSGGEGQRIRFGRALVREDVRLAILDEPFRGLDLARRSELLARARDLWRDATLLCVTHDIAETLSFGRVLVLEDGRVIEDGDPALLAGRADSAYAKLLADERAVEAELWSEGEWRRWHLEHGSITEISRTTEAEENVSWNSPASRGQ